MRCSLACASLNPRIIDFTTGCLQHTYKEVMAHGLLRGEILRVCSQFSVILSPSPPRHPIFELP